MNNDAILASISKIHAYRYAKKKQKGVKFGENQVTTMAIPMDLMLPLDILS